MRIYLAGSYSRKEELTGYANELKNMGHEVVSRWLFRDVSNDPRATAVEEAMVSVPQKEGVHFALLDLLDLDKAEMMIVFTQPARGREKGRGGYHVEFGYFIGMTRRVIVVGPRENIFYCLSDIRQFDDWESLIKARVL